MHVFSPPPRLGREGRAPATRAAAAPALSLPLELAPSPCSCPSAAAARAGGRARGAGTKGGGTSTHLGPEQKAAARTASPVPPGRLALRPPRPLSTLGRLQSAGGPLPQSHFLTIVEMTTFFPCAHFTESAPRSEGQTHLFSPWELFFRLGFPITTPSGFPSFGEWKQPPFPSQFPPLGFA